MLPQMDSRTERRYFNVDNTEPEFPCSNADCDAASWNDSDFAKCEVCARRFCGECLTKIEDLLFCQECLRCEQCAGVATSLCVECGGLTCAAHSSPRGQSARLCEHCKADPDDLPAEAYNPDNFRDAYAL